MTLRTGSSTSLLCLCRSMHTWTLWLSTLTSLPSSSRVSTQVRTPFLYISSVLRTGCLVIFKDGDDAHQDQFVLQLFTLVDQFLRREYLYLKLIRWRLGRCRVWYTLSSTRLLQQLSVRIGRSWTIRELIIWNRVVSTVLSYLRSFAKALSQLGSVHGAHEQHQALHVHEQI